MTASQGISTENIETNIQLEPAKLSDEAVQEKLKHYKEQTMPVLEEMKALPNWVVWSFEKRNDKFTKMPYNPKMKNKKAPAKSNEPMTWGTYEVACETQKAGNYDGIGFMFSNSDFMGIDIDHVGGQLKQFLYEDYNTNPNIIKDLDGVLNSYCEVSPSMKGAHFIVKGQLPNGSGGHKKRLISKYNNKTGDAEIEMYDSGRFFTFTEHNINGKDIAEVNSFQTELLINQFFGNSNDNNGRNKPRRTTERPQVVDTNLTDDQVIEKLLNENNGSKWESLLEGNFEPYYVSASEADMALINKLVFYTGGDEEQIDRIYRASLLYRKKWDEKHYSSGKTYGQYTIHKAINDADTYYGENYESQSPQERDDNVIAINPDTGEVIKTKNKKSKKTTNKKGKSGESEEPRRGDRIYDPRIPRKKGVVTYDLDNKGLVKRFVDENKDVFRHDNKTGGTYVFDKGTNMWEETPTDSGVAFDMMFNFIDELSQKGIDDHIPTCGVLETDIMDYAHFLSKRSETHRIKASLTAASNNKAVYIDSDIFDSDDYLLNTIDGYIDLKTGFLKERKKDNFFLKQTRTESFSPEPPKLWLEFLNTMLGGDKELMDYIQRVVGYSITGSTKAQKWFVLLGEGNNGKSLFLKVLRKILGDYARTLNVENFLGDGLSNGGINSEIAQTKRIRFLTSEEPKKDKALNDGMIKDFVAGGEVTQREIFKSSSPFKSQFKLWLAANNMPKINDFTNGSRRRLIIFPLGEGIDEDQVDVDLEDKLLGERESILGWAIEGAIKWCEEKSLGETPQVIKDAVDDFFEAQDQVAVFISEKIEITDNESDCIKSKEIYDAYKEWATDNNFGVLSNTSFGGRIKKFLEKKRTKKGNVFVNCKFKDSSDEKYTTTYEP